MTVQKGCPAIVISLTSTHLLRTALWTTRKDHSGTGRMQQVTDRKLSKYICPDIHSRRERNDEKSCNFTTGPSRLVCFYLGFTDLLCLTVYLKVIFHLAIMKRLVGKKSQEKLDGEDLVSCSESSESDKLIGNWLLFLV